MFDLSKVSETLSGLFGNGAAPGVIRSSGVLDLLQNAGIDPSLLEGLDQAQILELLSQHGVDPSLLGTDQINELLHNFAIPEQLTNIAATWLGAGGKS
jgi:hypothetical protein